MNEPAAREHRVEFFRRHHDRGVIGQHRLSRNRHDQRLAGIVRPVIEGLGYELVRLRLHGEVARIEVAPDRVAELAAPELREQIAEYLQGLGFRYVTLDLEGFRSGNLNG